jgi:hypothetical protein
VAVEIIIAPFTNIRKISKASSDACMMSESASTVFTGFEMIIDLNPRTGRHSNLLSSRYFNILRFSIW